MTNQDSCRTDQKDWDESGQLYRRIWWTGADQDYSSRIRRTGTKKYGYVMLLSRNRVRMNGMNRNQIRMDASDELEQDER